MNSILSEKITEYLKLYQIDPLLLPQLTEQVIQRVNLRLVQEQYESPLEVAIEEAQKVVDTWIVVENHLPATTEQILLARLKPLFTDSVRAETRLLNVPPLAELPMIPQKIEFWSFWQGLMTLLRYILNKISGLLTLIWTFFRRYL